MSDDRLYPPRFHSRYVVLTRLRRALERAISEHIEPLPADRRELLVDMGCGGAPYRPLFASHVSKQLGVDLPENQSADLFFESGTGRVPLPDGSADIVFSTQVLEHVPSPEAYLAEARRIMKPEGLMILTTHGYWMYHPSPTDYWRWTAEGLKLLLDRSGWEVIDCRGILGFRAAALHLFQDSLMPQVPNRLRGLFALLMQSGVGLADRFYSPERRKNNACLHLVVAKPPAEGAS